MARLLRIKKHSHREDMKSARKAEEPYVYTAFLSIHRISGKDSWFPKKHSHREDSKSAKKNKSRASSNGF
jgi:hypothetical protein